MATLKRILSLFLLATLGFFLSLALQRLPHAVGLESARSRVSDTELHSNPPDKVAFKPFQFSSSPSLFTPDNKANDRFERHWVWASFPTSNLDWGLSFVSSNSPTNVAHGFPHSFIPFRLNSAQDETADLWKLGQDLYRAGNFEAAARVWEQLANEETHSLNRAIALSNLSLCLQKLGRWDEAQGAIEESLSLLRSQEDGENPAVLSLWAQALNIQGNLEFSLGEYATALEDWQESERKYRQIDDGLGVSRSQLNQIQAFQGLGLYRRAEDTLNDLAAGLEAQPNSALKAAHLVSLGNILRVLGKLGSLDGLDKTSCEILENGASGDGLAPHQLSAVGALRLSLEIAQQLPSPAAISQAQFGLANVARAIYQREREFEQREQELHRPSMAKESAQTAFACYQRAAITPDPITGIRSQLNALNLLLELQWHQDEDDDGWWSLQLESLAENWRDLEAQIADLPLGRTAIYARVELAQSLMKLDRVRDAEGILVTAAEQANHLGDIRVQSYTLGHLGELYEQLGNSEKAKAYTQQALLLAQSIRAEDIAYQWQWQLGRILSHQTQPDIKGAIAAYDEAVKTLQSLRQDLVAISQDVQFDFRDRVEPVYREFVDLLLKAEVPSPEYLERARLVIEKLQLAELDNFFRDACSDAPSLPIDTIDPQAAAIYGIILDDRLEVIARLPHQTQLFHDRTFIPKEELTDTLRDLGYWLQISYGYEKIKELSAKVYSWLFAGIEPQLKGDETLVFVLDGELRNIPMAALYDGEQYLVKKYPVAIAPGLQLLDPKPLLQPLNALTGGLAYPPPPYQDLKNVTKELDAIEKLGVETYPLQEEEFTLQNLENQIETNAFKVVHLATHGKFSSQAEDTFILAADGPMNIKQFDTLFSSQDPKEAKAIDLLFLSACDTAPGDNRAVLGLAGVAVRSGARSTIATLWSVDDAASIEFVKTFYQQLVGGASRAQALRRAQLAFLEDRNNYDAPRYWAPYVLVGDWR